MNTFIEKIKNKKEVFLYISHEHQDHFDLETLNIIKSYVNMCLIPNYYDKFLKNSLDKLGLHTKELNDLEVFKFNKQDFIQLMILDTGINHDSTAFIKLKNKTFLNQNDCKNFDRLNFFSNKKINYYAV